jgi:hypothetical protein
MVGAEGSVLSPIKLKTELEKIYGGKTVWEDSEVEEETIGSTTGLVNPPRYCKYCVCLYAPGYEMTWTPSSVEKRKGLEAQRQFQFKYAVAPWPRYVPRKEEGQGTQHVYNMKLGDTCVDCPPTLEMWKAAYKESSNRHFAKRRNVKPTR